MASILITHRAGFIGTNFVRYWLREGPDVPVVVLHATNMERELGLRPTESFASGIEKAVQWYLDNEP